MVLRALRVIRRRLLQIGLTHDVVAQARSEQHERLHKLERRLEMVQEALGRIEARQLEERNSPALAANEFRVFSQWGEDGILQHLLRHVSVDNKTFVEFGVSNYVEANTRFLLVNNNWTGLVLDSSAENIAHIQESAWQWSYDLNAVSAFITRENINQLLESNGVTGEIGLLSIDVDGNDYWIWQAIHVISPVIVVVEYNHRFGKDAAVTIPYDPDFDRGRAHHSHIYFGASLQALCHLARQKGYAFVGCNSNGVNAFFVRADKRPDAVPALTPEEGYVRGRFGEVRDEAGRLVRMSFEDQEHLVHAMPLVHVAGSG